MWRCTCCGEIYDDGVQCPAWVECIREQRDELLLEVKRLEDQYDTLMDWLRNRSIIYVPDELE